jgi:hypothetical protein
MVRGCQVRVVHTRNPIQEAEIRRTAVRSQPRQIVLEKNPSPKKELVEYYYKKKLPLVY